MTAAAPPKDEEAPAVALADIPLGGPVEGDAAIGAAVLQLRSDVTVRLQRDGLAYVRQHPSAGPADMLALLLEVTAGAAYPRADQLNATLALPVACRAGCSACCHLTVVTTIPEAILVARALADPDHPQRQAVLEADRTFAGLDLADRLRTGRPCPLLNSDKSCAVYDVRPLACRGFMAPDADRCHRALANAIAGSGDDMITLHALPQFLGRGYKAGLNGLCRDLGLQHDLVELVRTVAAILDDPALVDRWAAGETVFRPFGAAPVSAA
jgi:Fe-S-cluster containining protein